MWKGESGAERQYSDKWHREKGHNDMAVRMGLGALAMLGT